MSNPTTCAACGGPLPADEPAAFATGGVAVCARCHHSDSPEVVDRVEAVVRRAADASRGPAGRRLDHGPDVGQNSPRPTRRTRGD